MPQLTKRVALFVTAFMAAVCVFSQPLEFRIKNYDEATGISNRKISTLLQDSKGFLWIGTADGLNRFDGYTFKIFKKTADDTLSIGGNNITALAEDKCHNIWIGFATGGISCYQPYTGHFINYPFTKKDAAIAGEVTMLHIDAKDNVWFGIRRKGLIQLDKTTKKFTAYNIVNENDSFFTKEMRSIFNTVYSATEMGDGLWLATHNGLYKFNIHTHLLEAVRQNPLQHNVFRNDLFNAIVNDKKGGIWLGSWAGGLTYFNTKTKEWKTYKYDKEHLNSETKNIISSIQFKSADELWVTSLDKGLGLFNIKYQVFFFFSDNPSFHQNIPAKLCYGILKDKEAGLWVWHKGGLTQIQQGIKQFPFKPFAVGHSDNGEFYEITAMREDSTNVYIGTSYADGFYVQDKATGHMQRHSFKYMNGEEKFLETADILLDSKGLVWVLTRDYVYQYNKQTRQLQLPLQPPVYSTTNPSNIYTKFVEDKQGNIWITSQRNGVFVYSKNTNSYTHYFNDPNNKNSPASNVIKTAMVDGRGRVWLGSNREGLIIFDPVQKKFTNIDVNNKIGLLSTRVYSLSAGTKGNIWAGTDVGLHEFDANAAIPKLKHIYTSQEGLLGDITYAIKEDANGNMWCITPVALCMLDTKKGTIKAYTAQDIVIKNDIGLRLFKTKDNKMRMLAAGGYYEFDPSSFKEIKKDFAVVITAFKVLDKERCYEDELASNKTVTIAAKENIFSFDFAAIEFNRTDKIQYAYMLEGFDKDWIYAGTRRYANYTNIPGGNYTFKVKATNTLNVWGNSFTSIPLHVKTPFYKTFWFALLSVAATAFITYFIYRYRLMQHGAILKLETKAQALEKEKTQVQYENLKQHLNPHFLFNSLTSLSSLIRTDQKLAITFLDGMSKIYRYILQSKDNDTIALKEEIKFIQTFIQLQQTRFQKGLQVHLTIDEEILHRKIVPVTLQNLIENAIKHNIIDEESPLVIEIYAEEEYLVVKNNLQKKSFVDTSNKQGLQSLQSLYKYLSDKPITCEEQEGAYYVKIPLI